jgi:uncharacterized membrane protein
MLTRLGWIGCLALTAAMTLLSLQAWAVLPPDARIATHFDFSGRPNGWSGVGLGLTVLPLLALIMTLAAGLWPQFSRRPEPLVRIAGSFSVIWLATIAVLALGHAQIVARALDHPFGGSQLRVGALGALFMVFGNMMGKLRQNHLAGIRTPWTLADETVWARTNRFGGFLFFAVGLVILLASFSDLPPHTLRLLMIGSLVGASLVSVAKSYLIWREVRPNG